MLNCGPFDTVLVPLQIGRERIGKWGYAIIDDNDAVDRERNIVSPGAIAVKNRIAGGLGHRRLGHAERWRKHGSTGWAKILTFEGLDAALVTPAARVSGRAQNTGTEQQHKTDRTH